MTTKVCNTCKETKPLSLFGKNNTSKDSVSFHASMIPTYKGDCKACLALYAKAYREANPNLWKDSLYNVGKITKYTPEERPTLSAIRDRISGARQNSKRNPDRQFSIDADYMYQIWKDQNGMCNLSGRPLKIIKGDKDSLSLDKIQPELGYVKGNVQWLTWAVNRAKGDLSTTDYLQLCKDVVEKCRDYP